MGSGISKKAESTNSVNTKKTFPQYQPQKLLCSDGIAFECGSRSNKDRKQVDLFLNRMLPCAKQTDIITNMLMNEQSRGYFIAFLKREFGKNDMVISSWQVSEAYTKEKSLVVELIGSSLAGHRR
jgi:hypothetical protein